MAASAIRRCTFKAKGQPIARIAAFTDEEAASPEVTKLIEAVRAAAPNLEDIRMSAARVSLANENVAYAGVVSFDGEVLEALGFADTVRVPHADRADRRGGAGWRP